MPDTYLAKKSNFKEVHEILTIGPPPKNGLSTGLGITRPVIKESLLELHKFNYKLCTNAMITWLYMVKLFMVQKRAVHISINSYNLKRSNLGTILVEGGH